MAQKVPPEFRLDFEQLNYCETQCLEKISALPATEIGEERKTILDKEHLVNYRPEVDGLRAIAVLAVVFFHVDFGFTGGFVGVDIFFVISGFLISSIIFRNLCKGNFSMVEFYERRVRRIAPALAAMILGTSIASWFTLLPDDFVRFGNAVIAQPLMISNVYHWRNSDYFSPNAETFPLLHTWSLAVEEQFYLFFPLLLAIVFKWRRSFLFFAVTLMFLASLYLAIWATPRFPKAAFYLLPTRAWELLVGSLLALLPDRRLSASQWTSEIGSAVGLIAIAISVFAYTPSMSFPGAFALLPCLGTVLFIWANGKVMTWSGKVVASKPLVYIGKISYSLYLVHWPVIVLYRYWHWEDSGWVQSVWLIVVSFGLATLSYFLIETPFRRKDVLRSRSQLFLALSMACLVLVGTGTAIVHWKGCSSRFAPEALGFLDARLNLQSYDWVDVDDVVRGDLPVFGTPGGNCRVLLWGDSHAFVLLPVLDEICKESSIKGMQATHACTAPFLGFVSRGVMSLKERSVAFNQAVEETVRNLKIDTVILAGQWSIYPVDLHTKSYIESTINALVGSGVSVIVVLDVAKMEHDAPMELARAIRTGADIRSIGVDLEKHRQLNQHYDQIFSQLAERNSDKVFLCDPAEAFVDESGLWRAEYDNISMYADDNHLSIDGSLRMKPLLKSAFRKAKLIVE